MCTDLYSVLLQPKTGTVADTLRADHIIIILVIFCLILFGMCFTLIFNCVRKLIHDHRIIQVSVLCRYMFSLLLSYRSKRRVCLIACASQVVFTWLSSPASHYWVPGKPSSQTQNLQVQRPTAVSRWAKTNLTLGMLPIRIQNYKTDFIYKSIYCLK
jgi:hypothetical protein